MEQHTRNSSGSGSRPRFHASSACSSCRGMKKKCDQAQPCSNCRKTGRNCVYDLDSDGRRAAVRKRKTEDLQRRGQSLNNLIDALKNAPQAQAERIVEMIRQDKPLDDILESLARLPTPTPPPESLPPSRHGRNYLSISAIVDVPTVEVPASPRTTVTGDSSAVSHLMSTYLNWCHHNYYFFYEDLFLDAMRREDLNSPYCSRLLVNACLGIGCLFTDDNCAFQDLNDRSGTRAQHYFNEAQQLWIQEAARPSLINFQGLSVLIMLAALAGKDRIAFMHLPQLPIMMQQVLAKSRLHQPPNMEKSLRLMQVTNFICQTAFRVSAMQPAARISPMSVDPFNIKEDPGPAIWSAYPISRPSIDVQTYRTFNDLHNLYKIGAELQDVIYGASWSTMSLSTRFEQAKAIDQRLLSWHESLPQEYQYQRPEYILAAPTVDLTFSYFHFVHHCYQTIITKDIELDASTQKIEDDIKHRLLEIAFAERDLIRRWKVYYGQVSYSMLMPQPVNLCLHILFNYIHDESVQDLLLELFTTFVQVTNRWRIIQGLTRVIIGTTEDKGDDIPHKVKKELNRLADGVWKPQDHLQFSSQYPNYVLAREKLETLEMSDLLEKWADMRLGPDQPHSDADNEDDDDVDDKNDDDWDRVDREDRGRDREKREGKRRVQH